MFNRRKSKTRKVDRGGVAVSECALCIPIIVVFTIFAIEVCGVIFLKEAVTIAAYEGARVGIQRGGTNANVEFRIQQFLDERGIVYDDPVTIQEPGFDDAADMEHVTTTVSVPIDGNVFTGWIFGNSSLQASVTMRKEFPNPN